jgi:hypothetical protein
MVERAGMSRFLRPMLSHAINPSQDPNSRAFYGISSRRFVFGSLRLVIECPMGTPFLQPLLLEFSAKLAYGPRSG